MILHIFLLLITQAHADRASCGPNHYKPRLIVDSFAYNTQSPDQKLDVYVPGGAPKPLKTVVLYHGGCFQGGSRRQDDTMDYVKRLTGAGYAVVSVDYRLAKPNPDNPSKSINKYPAQLEDAQDAWCWVQENGAAKGLATEKMVAMGWSAGGTIAGWIGTNHTAGETHRPSCTPKVAGTSIYFGRTNFLKHTEPVPAGNAFGMDCGEAMAGERRDSLHPQQIFKDMDLPTHTDVKSIPPIYDAHGNADQYVNIAQGEVFCKSLSGKCTLNIVDKADHGFGKEGEMDKADDGLCKFLRSRAFAKPPAVANVAPALGAGSPPAANH